jgi:aminopeptidase N
MDDGLAKNRVGVIAYWYNKPLPIVNYDLITYPRIENFKLLLNTNTYQKAGWVLHMLRNELGDKVFFEVIRSYYKTYRDANADTEDFQHIAEKVSGKDLQGFFKQWLYGKGQPVIAGSWTSKGGEISIDINQLQEEPFVFPLEVGLVYGDKMITKKVAMKSSVEHLTLSEKTPDKIILDPNTKLLYEGDALLIRN